VYVNSLSPRSAIDIYHTSGAGGAPAASPPAPRLALSRRTTKIELLPTRDAALSASSLLQITPANKQNTIQHAVGYQHILCTMTVHTAAPVKAQIPRCRLARQVRDKFVTSPLAITPTSPKLPRRRHFSPNSVTPSRRNGIWAKEDVTGLSRTSRGSRHSGI